MASASGFASDADPRPFFGRSISGMPDNLTCLPNELKYEVTSYLTTVDLGRLARCSRIWRQFTTPVLYLKNARSENSSAIKWAVMADCKEADQFTRRKTLVQAIHYEGNVNAVHKHKIDDAEEDGYVTALHIAAAKGRLGFVKLLLQHGAVVNTFSEGLAQLPGLGIDQKMVEAKLLNAALVVGSRHALWLPLLVPFVLGHKDVVELLLEHGALPELAVDNTDSAIRDASAAGEPDSLTILHVLATNDQREATDRDGNCLFQRFNYSINKNLPGGGDTALHVALSNPNWPTLEKLIAAGADVEAITNLGKTPLLVAIGHCYKSKSPQTRKRYLECIEGLIEAGADVNVHSHPSLSHTPLIAAIKAVPQDWRNVFREMKATIRLLLDNGALINERSAQGMTVVHVLCEEIHRKRGSTSLEALLKEFVAYGGNVNIPYPGGGSIMKRVLFQSESQSPGLLRVLLDANATILDEEVDVVFDRWCGSSNRITRSYDIFKHKDLVSQRAINRAYLHAFDGEPNKLYQLLRENFPVTTIAERLIVRVLKTPRMKLGPPALDLDFDAKYVDRHGDSLLHMVISKLQDQPLYKESAAIVDATALIVRGASVKSMDRRGYTVLQRLREMERPYRDLRFVLHEAKDIEDAEC